MQIQFLWSGATYKTRTKLPLASLAGTPLGEMDNVPAILVSRIAQELRKSPKQGLDEIHAAMKRAAHLFAHEVIDGESPSDYVKNAHLISGTPMGTIEESIEQLKHVLDMADEYTKKVLPQDVQFFEATTALTRGVYRVASGTVLSVVAPGNNPGVHKSWLEALAAGYKILLRPSLKEPFTPYRLVKCLLAAGISQEMLAFVPGEHALVNEMVEYGDHVLLFGDKNVVEKYQHHRKVIVRGPGYSKVYWDATAKEDPARAIEAIVSSIADDGGMKCTNASGIVTDRSRLAALPAIGDKINGYAAGGLLDPRGTSPVFQMEVATRIKEYLQQIMQQANVLWTNRDLENVLIDCGDGTATLAPLVFQVEQLKPEILSMELPFACSWVYAAEERELSDIFRNTLAVTIMTENYGLIKNFMGDPTIKKVVTGSQPTFTTYDLIPHDGYLIEQLFVTKGFI